MSSRHIGVFLASAACLLLPHIAAAQIGAGAQGGKLTTWVAVGIGTEISSRWAAQRPYWQPEPIEASTQQTAFTTSYDLMMDSIGLRKEIRVKLRRTFSPFSLCHWMPNCYLFAAPTTLIPRKPKFSSSFTRQ